MGVLSVGDFVGVETALDPCFGDSGTVLFLKNIGVWGTVLGGVPFQVASG